MTGKKYSNNVSRPLVLALVTLTGLAACDENGDFSFPSKDDAAAETSSQPTRQLVQTDSDVERPDVFEVTDRGLWDGRPSLGGVWVAHPDVSDPERVMIRNPENGKSVIGALFRRERENPGPLLQVSSDAAEELGLLAGAPTELNVVALRRVEIEVPEEPVETPDENPVVASLAAPVGVAETSLDTESDSPSAAALPDAPSVDPIAGAAAAIAAAEAGLADGSTPTEVTVPVAAAATGDATAPLAQVGVFSVERNANGAAQKIRNAGIKANVEPFDAGGRTVWRVVAGPVSDDAALEQLKAIGFVDAFVVPAE
ncbi:cell division septation protein DedD [Yoonia maritima]|uniref:Cell division septation protein DedD n=1 Tax=Yoonia maritima TaxID=1435347 RepID=A0A2T0W3Z2_9RHOB|nr:SPOR domain-containing protein [Yoonia maritima]PRY80180.1 cell division septation protein DedD [Yoonia maritima]